MNNNQPAAEVQAPRQFKIDTCRLEVLRDELAKLDAKAAKLGVAPVVLTEGETVTQIEAYGLSGETFWTKDDGSAHVGLTGASRSYTLCTVSGEAPKLAGYSLVAVIEHLGEDGNLIRKVPSTATELPAEYHDALPTCDHCKAFRNRTETFVLAHESGKLARVGRNCLSNFLGGIDPAALLAGFEVSNAAYLLFGEAENEGEGGGFGSGRVSELYTRSFLAYVSASIRKHGWTSSKTAREQGRASTAGFVVAVLTGRDLQKELKEITPTEDDHKLAEAALAYARSLKESGKELSDYEHNLAVVCARAGFELRHAGLVASIIPAYQRHANIVSERARVANLLANSQHVGAVGERRDFNVTVLKTVELESQYGRKVLFALVDDAGNSLNWFATGAGCDLLELGKSYSVKATISGHNEYKGVKQTLLKRVAINPTAEELAAVAAEKALRKLAEKELKAKKKVHTEAARVLNAAAKELDGVAHTDPRHDGLRKKVIEAGNEARKAAQAYESALNSKVAELRAAKQAA